MEVAPLRLVAQRLLAGPLARKALGLSGLTAAGQLSFLLALPLLSRTFSPTDFGHFAIYLSLVNIGGPIAGLKFESALYTARTRAEARLVLALCAVTALGTTMLATILAVAIGSRVSLGVAGEQATVLALAPVGVLMAATWGISSAWAVKSDAIPALGVARFLQPTFMTVLQLAAGAAHLPGTCLIVAHLLSHIAYNSFLFSRTINRRDLRALGGATRQAVFARAKMHWKFPALVMPAHVGSLMTSNLPPVLVGLLFGAESAGYCGIAYRIVAAPLAIVSLPLGHVLTSEASRAGSDDRILALCRRVFGAAVVLVALPLLLCALLAPTLAGLVLGSRWIATGEFVAALAVFGGAQAVASPFTELFSIHRIQGLRFATESATTALVLAPFCFCTFFGWSAVTTIWLMSIGGAAASFAGLCQLRLALLRHRA